MKGVYGRILFIDCSTRTFRVEPMKNLGLDLPGGKALGTRLLLELNPAGVAPLAPDNHFIITTGPCCGTVGLGRQSIRRLLQIAANRLLRGILLRRQNTGSHRPRRFRRHCHFRRVRQPDRPGHPPGRLSIFTMTCRSSKEWRPTRPRTPCIENYAPQGRRLRQARGSWSSARRARTWWRSRSSKTTTGAAPDGVAWARCSDPKRSRGIVSSPETASAGPRLTRRASRRSSKQFQKAHNADSPGARAYRDRAEPLRWSP